MARLAVSGFVGFSDAPLLLAVWIGAVVSGLGLAYGLFVVGTWAAGADLVPGWASIIVVVTVLCGMNMLLTGIVGLYVARIHAEVKRRPLYIVAEALGFEAAGKPAERMMASSPTFPGPERGPSFATARRSA
jgi:hypothetical protein